MKFDKVMDEIGFGKWQLKNCLLAFPILMWAGLTTLFQTFAGKQTTNRNAAFYGI